MKLSISLLLAVPLLGTAKAASAGLRVHRKLSDDPCAIPFEDAIHPQAPDRFKPSYLTNCLRSLEVPTNNTLQHINNLRDTFRDYESFYNIANDVNDSKPIAFQPELGYTLFTGPEEGQVNLQKELTDLLNKVASTQKATIGTFHEIQTIFNKARDAHIFSFNLAGQVSVATNTRIWVFPQSSPDGLTLQSWEPSYNDNGELEVKVIFNMTNGNQREETVVSIDGKTPFQWYLDFSSDPAVGYNRQSVGARMNLAFQKLLPTDKRLGFPAITLFGRSMPPDVLPETFIVGFASGNEEIFAVAAGIGIDTDTAQDIYTFLNSGLTFAEPGAPYHNFEIALGLIEDATLKDVMPMMQRPDDNLLQYEPLQGSSDANFEFDGTFEVPGKTVGAYKIRDEYAVFKLWDFDFFDNGQGGFAVLDFWSTFTAAAKAKGVKKAIIDMSQNGGGTVQSGQLLAISMYPFSPFQDFNNDYDITYNQAMLAYTDSIIPVLGMLGEEINGYTDEELEEKLKQLDNKALDQMLAVAKALRQYCEVNCGALDVVISEIEALILAPSAEQYRKLLQQLVGTIPTYNPFTVVEFLKTLDPNVIRPVIRGGVAQNLTNKFGILNQDVYHLAVVRSLQNEWLFDEYRVVGEGTGGSTTAIFSTTVMQLSNAGNPVQWVGRNVQPAPLTTISFGGTNLPQDTTVAGFPASVRGVNFAAPIIAAGLVFMAEFLIPGSASEPLRQANEVYKSTLVQPAYYITDMPHMPVYNFYSTFMGDDAIPVQYIKIFSADHVHLPQVYNGINGREGQDSSDLETIYEAACKATQPPTPAPTTLPPTPAPTPPDPNELLPVLSVATETSVSAEEIAESWASFRRSYPQRIFCLLQVRQFGGGDLRVPRDFALDPLVRYKRISYDYGDAFQQSDWFNLCGLDEFGDVTTFPLLVNFDRADLVRASLGFYKGMIDSSGGQIVEVPKDSANGNWIQPLNKDFV